MHKVYATPLFSIGLMLAWVPWASALAAHPQPEMLFVTPANCRLINGYGKHDLLGVAQALQVPVQNVRYLRAEWGKGLGDFPQCQVVFATPKGVRSCKVLNIMKEDFVFALVVAVPGQPAICH